MSYGENVSDSYLLEGSNKGLEDKRQTPGDMKTRPNNNENWSNNEENHFSICKVSLVQDLSIIPDKFQYVEMHLIKNVTLVRDLSIIPDKFQYVEMHLIKNVFCIRAIPWCSYDIANVKKYRGKLQLLNGSRCKGNFNIQ